MTNVHRFPLPDETPQHTHPRGTRPTDPRIITSLHAETINFLRGRLAAITPRFHAKEVAYERALTDRDPGFFTSCADFEALREIKKKLEYCIREATWGNWEPAKQWFWVRHLLYHELDDGPQAATFLRYASLCRAFQSGSILDLPLIDQPAGAPETT